MRHSTNPDYTRKATSLPKTMHQLWRRYTRFVKFGAVGAGVFVLGLACMYVLVSLLHLHPQVAFLTTTFVSVEVNFLLNRRFTWRDRAVSFWSALWKFNLSRAFTIPLGQALYALLYAALHQYMIATIIHTAVFTVLTFLIGHFWAFRAKGEPEVTAAVPAES